jgi:DNA-binding MurR/RpiR family transcriptional regulator
MLGEPMTLREIVENYDGRLTNADRQLLDALFANPNEGTFLSAQEVAERASVHPTSAVRLAQKLGFSGYPELRAKLREDLLGRPEAAERIQQRLEHLDQGSLKAFVDSEVATLQALPEQVSQPDLEAAAHAIVDATRIFLFGYSHSEALVMLMEMRLARSGYTTRIMRQSEHHLATDLANMTENDVLLLFAFNAVDKRVPAILEHAALTGTRSIAITDSAGLLLRPNPDILMRASRGQPGEAQSLTVPMAICNTLILIISQLDQGHSINRLEKASAIRAKLREL